MLLGLVSHMKLNPLLILYDEPESILLWKDFIETELKSNLLPPKFATIKTEDSEHKNLLVNFVTQFSSDWVLMPLYLPKGLVS